MAARAGPEVEAKILALCKKHPAGWSQAQLQAELHGDVASVTLLTSGINQLLSRNRLRILRGPDGTHVYQEVAADEAAKQRGLSKEDHLVLQELKLAGNKGMWTKTLRKNTNLAPQLVARALKNLEQRALVKSVKSIQSATKKLYMLHDLEPATEITGGAWYTDQSFDQEFFTVLQRASLQFIRTAGSATLDDVASALRDKGISTVELRDEDVLAVLRTLEYDGGLECGRGAGEDDEDIFRERRLALPEYAAPTSFPCGVCKVIKECSDDGPISPATCVYWQRYLDF